MSRIAHTTQVLKCPSLLFTMITPRTPTIQNTMGDRIKSKGAHRHTSKLFGHSSDPAQKYSIHPEIKFECNRTLEHNLRNNTTNSPYHPGLVIYPFPNKRPKTDLTPCPKAITTAAPISSFSSGPIRVTVASPCALSISPIRSPNDSSACRIPLPPRPIRWGMEALGTVTARCAAVASPLGVSHSHLLGSGRQRGEGVAAPWLSSRDANA